MLIKERKNTFVHCHTYLNHVHAPPLFATNITNTSTYLWQYSTVHSTGIFFTFPEERRVKGGLKWIYCTSTFTFLPKKEKESTA
jgi:hypothetical protein